MLVGWQTKWKDKSCTWPEMLGTSQPPVALPASQGLALNSPGSCAGLGGKAGHKPVSVAVSYTAGSNSLVNASIPWTEIWPQVPNQMISRTSISMHAGACLPQSRIHIHPQPCSCLWWLLGVLISFTCQFKKRAVPHFAIANSSMLLEVI